MFPSVCAEEEVDCLVGGGVGRGCVSAIIELVIIFIERLVVVVSATEILVDQTSNWGSSIREA